MQRESLRTAKPLCAASHDNHWSGRGVQACVSIPDASVSGGETTDESQKGGMSTLQLLEHLFALPSDKQVRILHADQRRAPAAFLRLHRPDAEERAHARWSPG
jgi:hypothetical protein